jgi:hypothetical protein
MKKELEDHLELDIGSTDRLLCLSIEDSKILLEKLLDGLKRSCKKNHKRHGCRAKLIP